MGAKSNLDKMYPGMLKSKAEKGFDVTLKCDMSKVCLV